MLLYILAHARSMSSDWPIIKGTVISVLIELYSFTYPWKRRVWVSEQGENKSSSSKSYQ